MIRTEINERINKILQEDKTQKQKNTIDTKNIHPMI